MTLLVPFVMVLSSPDLMVEIEQESLKLGQSNWLLCDPETTVSEYLILDV